MHEISALAGPLELGAQKGCAYEALADSRSGEKVLLSFHR